MGLDVRKLAVSALALAACGFAGASENYDLRYAPGDGGADMSAPFEGGWVFQLGTYVYSGKINQHSSIVSAPVTGVSATSEITSRLRVDVEGILPRLSYMSSVSFLGGTLGGTALLPIVNKRSMVSLRSVSTTLTPASLPSATATVITSAVNSAVGSAATELADANSNSATGIGDLELAPIIRWATDNTQTLFIASVIFPTGDFRTARATNPGGGHFYTFRPAVQWSYIGNGWDFGSRAAFSFNTTDSQTHFRTGDYLNIDATLMKSLSDSSRIGLAGYAVAQTTRDTRDQVPDETTLDGQALNARQETTLGDKGHVFGLGPEFAYIHGAGDFLVDGRLIREFGASDRPQGLTFWLKLSKPF